MACMTGDETVYQAQMNPQIGTNVLLAVAGNQLEYADWAVHAPGHYFCRSWYF